MDSENNDIFKIVCVKEAVKDYHSSQVLDERNLSIAMDAQELDGNHQSLLKSERSAGKSFCMSLRHLWGQFKKIMTIQVLLR